MGGNVEARHALSRRLEYRPTGRAASRRSPAVTVTAVTVTAVTRHHPVTVTVTTVTTRTVPLRLPVTSGRPAAASGGAEALRLSAAAVPP